MFVLQWDFLTMKFGQHPDFRASTGFQHSWALEAELPSQRCSELLGMPGVTWLKVFSSLSVEVCSVRGHSTSVPGDQPVGGREYQWVKPCLVFNVMIFQGNKTSRKTCDTMWWNHHYCPLSFSLNILFWHNEGIKPQLIQMQWRLNEMFVSF